MKTLILLASVLITTSNASNQDLPGLTPAFFFEDCRDSSKWDKSEEELVINLDNLKLETSENEEVVVYRCKIEWGPEIPAESKLIEANLGISGEIIVENFGLSKLRVGHKLLGLGTISELESFKPETNLFELSIPVQNVAEQDCSVATKLITNLFVLLRAPKDGPVKKKAEVILSNISLTQPKFEKCIKNPEEKIEPIKEEKDETSN